MDQRDPEGVWPNLSQRSNEQQDNNKRIKFETDQIKPSWTPHIETDRNQLPRMV
jgi:hypothetical protein